MASALRRILVLTDGRAGNENQALGLAEAISRRLSSEAAAPSMCVERLAVAPIAAAAPAAALHIAARAIGDAGLGVAAPILDRLRRGEESLGSGDLVIGAGRRSAPAVAALRRRGARAAQILNPQAPLSAFDLVVAPAHDRLRGPNVIATLGATHRIDAASLAARPPDPRLGPPRADAPTIAVLIGGPSASASFTDADVQRLAAALERLGAEGAHLIATASRRTAGAARARLADATQSGGGFFWDGAGENPYLSMLAAADAIVVTADSVNMASEAAATAAPVFVAELSGLSEKLTRFHQALAAADRTRPLAVLAPERADAAPLRRRLADWRPAPLSDMDAAVDRVLALFGAAE